MQDALAEGVSPDLGRPITDGRPGLDHTLNAGTVVGSRSDDQDLMRSKSFSTLRSMIYDTHSMDERVCAHLTVTVYLVINAQGSQRLGSNPHHSSADRCTRVIFYLSTPTELQALASKERGHDERQTSAFGPRFGVRTGLTRCRNNGGYKVVTLPVSVT
jgi:hypothetical protein